MSLLSIIIPVYNEQATLEQLVKQVLAVKFPKSWQTEIIIVNDASKDNSPKIIAKLSKEYKNIRGLTNEVNLGKTQTVKKGILVSKGDAVIIQDADLEYDPNEILLLIKKMTSEKLDVVYGDRFGVNNKIIYLQNYIGNKFVSFVSNIFTYPRIRVSIGDVETCYKLIRGDVARDVAQHITATSNFGFEPEVTARLARYKLDGNRLRFGTVPIHYFARTIEQGKKMKAFRDGFKAIYEIVKYNLF